LRLCESTTMRVFEESTTQLAPPCAALANFTVSELIPVRDGERQTNVESREAARVLAATAQLERVAVDVTRPQKGLHLRIAHEPPAQEHGGR
jgi:hypothetical protein